ncbi:MAG TPA: hypothetical protein VLG28_02340 [Acidimicrobiia bacterium]|jgi:hypothetical protein|nr:hypothetical protein [Acidimicrobiia bacterium]
MLRESSLAENAPLDLSALRDRTKDPLVPGGATLLALVDAALLGTASDLNRARSAMVTELGHDALVDAAAVFATFAMMNRVAEGTGIPVGKGRLASTADLRAEAGLDAIRHDG